MKGTDNVSRSIVLPPLEETGAPPFVGLLQRPFVITETSDKVDLVFA